MADFGHGTFIFIIGTSHHIHKNSRQPQLSRQRLPFFYVYAGHFSQFFVVICHNYSGQFVFTEMSSMVQYNFMTALPKGTPLVHRPMEAIHPAHHRMASTLLDHLPMETIHPAHHSTTDVGHAGGPSPNGLNTSGPSPSGGHAAGSPASRVNQTDNRKAARLAPDRRDASSSSDDNNSTYGTAGRNGMDTM